jgi:hypothetical protein
VALRAVPTSRICVLLAAAVFGALAGGCGSATATPTVAQCVSAWNRGQIATEPGLSVGQSPAVFGYLGRRVWVRGSADPGSGDSLPSVACAITFDLGGGRILSFGSDSSAGNDASASRAAARGLVFEPAGVGGDWVMPAAAARILNADPGSGSSTLAGRPDACQGDDGVVRVSGCPPHASSVQPATFLAWRNRLHATAVEDLAGEGRTWWVGLTFRGFGAVAGPALHRGRQVVYQVEAGPQAWQMWVITVDSRSASPPGCAALHIFGTPQLCRGGRLTGRLLDALRPDPRHWVAVYTASWSPRAPGEPLPQAIADRVQAALRPVRVP